MPEKLLPHCPAGGEAVGQPGADDSGECFAEDEFICPACCCGIYIEVKEES